MPLSSGFCSNWLRSAKGMRARSSASTAGETPFLPATGVTRRMASRERVFAADDAESEPGSTWTAIASRPLTGPSKVFGAQFKNGATQAVEDLNRAGGIHMQYFDATEGHDAAERETLLKRTHSGGVVLNDWGWQGANHDLPVGGIGTAGMGNYHGEEG